MKKKAAKPLKTIKTAKTAKAVKAPLPVREKPEIIEKMVNCLYDNKGEEIRVLNTAGLSDLWDYFVVCSGTSTVHTRALRDHLKQDLAAAGFEPFYEDRGFENKWIVMDYGDVLVHIFEPDTRLYYAIEKMWGENEEPFNSFLSGGKGQL